MARHHLWDDSDLQSGLHWNAQSLLDKGSVLDALSHGGSKLIAAGLDTSDAFTTRPPVSPLTTQEAPQTIERGPLFAGPNQAAEIAFLNGLTASDKIAVKSFATWNFDSPATYNPDFAYAAKWGSGTPGTGAVVDYFFDKASLWNATEKGMIESALALWSSVANVQFHEVTKANDADFKFRRGSDGSAYEQDSSYAGSPADAGTVGGDTLLTRAKAYISIDTSVPGFGPMNGNFQEYGGYVWGTIVHEIGHSLGLGHGGAYNGNVDPMTEQFSAYDTLLWTVMSYVAPDEAAKFESSYPVTADWGTVVSHGHTYGNTATTMMALDILAVQQLYGAPVASALGGGQTFGFHSTVSGPIQGFYDFTINTDPVITIFSTGTGNTLDFSGFTENATVDLNPGTFSSCNGQTNNICIAYNTVINSYVGAKGDDTVRANANADTIKGGKGDDTVNFASTLTSADAVNGGAGHDTVIIAGNYFNLTLGATTLVQVEKLQLTGGFSYKIVTNDANVAANKTLEIDCQGAGFGYALTFDGSAETNGKFNILGGNGDDKITGGAKADTINGGSGHNTITGGRGGDTITVSADINKLVYTAVNQSGSDYDILKAFDFTNNDQFDLNVSVTAIDAAVTTGTLRGASFDADLTAAIGSAQLGLHHAVLFTADEGGLAGQTFLIVEAGGGAGYQAGSDYVFRLDGALHLNDLNTADFV